MLSEKVDRPQRLRSKSFELSLLVGISSIVGFLSAPNIARARVTNPGSSVRCSLRLNLIPGTTSDAKHIRIRMANRKVDDYLPRCALATFVVAKAEGHDGAFRATFREMGARWSVGQYFCRYRYHQVAGRDETRIAHTCVHKGQYANTVWFDTYV